MQFTLEAVSSSSSLLEVCAKLYSVVWTRDFEDALWNFRQYTHYPFFHCYLAFAQSRAVGFALGTASLKGQWWHDMVAEQVGADHPSLQNAWVLTELAVLPEYRNLGVGLALHNQVLQTQPLANVLLSTMQSNVGARRFYERQHWTYLHPGFSFFERQEPYVIMHKTLYRA